MKRKITARRQGALSFRIRKKIHIELDTSAPLSFKNDERGAEQVEQVFLS